jgi:hypothetical protein
MINNRAFARSIAMFTEINTIHQSGKSILEQRSLLDGIGEYKSRGKGGKFKAGGLNRKAYLKMMRQKNRVITNMNSAGQLEHIWIAGNGKRASSLTGHR